MICIFNPCILFNNLWLTNFSNTCANSQLEKGKSEQQIWGVGTTTQHLLHNSDLQNRLVLVLSLSELKHVYDKEKELRMRITPPQSRQNKPGFHVLKLHNYTSYNFKYSGKFVIIIY